MTNDIPETYLNEALQQVEAFFAAMYSGQPGYFDFNSFTVRVVARTLQKLGWTPPIDEARMAKARKVAAAVAFELGEYAIAKNIRCGLPSASAQAAYGALGED